MKELEKIIEILGTIKTNIKKTGSKPYTLPTLLDKEKKVEELLLEAKLLKPEQTTLGVAQKFASLYETIKKLAEDITEQINIQKAIHESVNSTNMPFDIKTATALIPQYNGKEDDTESFLEAISLLDELTEAADKPIMLKFIKTRITGKAKLAITEDLRSIADIKTKFRQKFSIRLSFDAVLAQLSSTQK